MTKLLRVNQRIFASDTGVNQMGQIGSMAAGTPVYSIDPDEIQSLEEYETGLYGICLGNNSPAMQDINALYFLITRQLAYLMQAGVAEWNSACEYHIGSIVNDELGNLYKSKIDTNVNHPVSSSNYWERLGDTSGVIRTLQNKATRAMKCVSSITQRLWRGVAYDEEYEVFLAIAEDGTTAQQLIASVDGETWTTRTVPSTYTWKGIVYAGGAIEKAFAFGHNVGLTESKIMEVTLAGTSNAIVSTLANKVSLKAGCYSPSLDMVVFVGGPQGGVNKIITSVDGVTFTERTNPKQAMTLLDVCWSPELELFVAVGEVIDASSAVLTSPDGVTWTLVASAGQNYLAGVKWSKKFMKFVAISSGGGTDSAIESYDGITWAVIEDTGGNGNATKLLWIEDLELFIATDCASGVYVSRDGGYVWEQQLTYNSTLTDEPKYHVACYAENLSRLVALSDNAGYTTTQAFVSR